MLHVLPHSFPTRRASVLYRPAVNCHRKTDRITIACDRRSPLAAAAFLLVFIQVGRPDDCPCHPHRTENLRHLAAISGRLHIEFGESRPLRSEEHTSDIQSLMRISYAVLCSKIQKPLTSANTETSHP